MNETTRIFLDSLLIQNPVFMTFVGALMATVLPTSARRSFTPAARYAVVFFFSMLTGGAFALAVGDVFAPVVYLSVALVAIVVLRSWGELRLNWLGMPAMVLAAAPLVGLQVMAAGQGDFAAIAAAAGGYSLGFFVAFVTIGGIREASRMTDAKAVFKTNPVVLYSMALIALALAGFLFW